MRLMPPLLELADMFNVILRRCRNSRADSDLVRGALSSTVPPSVPAWLPHIHAWQLDASGTAQAMRHTAREWLGGASPAQRHVTGADTCTSVCMPPWRERLSGASPASLRNVEFQCSPFVRCTAIEMSRHPGLHVTITVAGLIG